MDTVKSYRGASSHIRYELKLSLIDSRGYIRHCHCPWASCGGPFRCIVGLLISQIGGGLRLEGVRVWPRSTCPRRVGARELIATETEPTAQPKDNWGRTNPRCHGNQPAAASLLHPKPASIDSFLRSTLLFFFSTVKIHIYRVQI
jgi:hypothetical protein